MAINFEPAKSITGGPWYEGSEFDDEYVSVIEKVIIGLLKRWGAMTITELKKKFDAKNVR